MKQAALPPFHEVFNDSTGIFQVSEQQIRDDLSTSQLEWDQLRTLTQHKSDATSSIQVFDDAVDACKVGALQLPLSASTLRCMLEHHTRQQCCRGTGCS